MGCEWPTKSFAELINSHQLEIGDGYRAKNDELGGDGLIFLRAGQVSNSHISFGGVDRFHDKDRARFGEKISRAGDVVITTKGNSTGRVSSVTAEMPPFVYSPHLSYWRASSSGCLEQSFLRAWSRGPEFTAQLGALSRSTDMAPYLSLTDQRRLNITIPPREVQSWIGTFNTAIEERIDLLRQTNTTLEAIAQALFKSWFVDFDPVHAKAEGREPEAMDTATAALFPSEFEESELGLIPKRWCVRRLADSLSVQIGGAWGEEHESKKSTVRVSCLRGIDAVDIGGGTKPNVPARWVSQRQIASRTLAEGDILVEGSGSFCGRSLYWISSYSELVPLTPTYSNFVKRLKSPSGREVAHWASLHLTQIFRSGEVSNYRTGSAFPNLDVDGLLGKKVAVPDSETIFQAFFDIGRTLLEEKKNSIVTSVVLTELRDTLLPRLISGKLRLPEAERFVEAMV